MIGASTRPAMRQRGFTLIEVVVAFVIFALCSGALYEGFAAAVRRSAASRAQELALMQAQSLLAEQRVKPAPWQATQAGDKPVGMLWRMEIAPLVKEVDVQHPWQAYEVRVQVYFADRPQRGVTLQSVEWTRSLQ